MLRGTRSRARPQHSGQHQHQQPSATNQTSKSTVHPKQVTHIDASLAKQHVLLDIEKIERSMELIKRDIGSTKLEIVKSDKRADAIKKQIELLEASTPMFLELSKLKEPSEIIGFLDKNKAPISRLPSDQREMLDILRERNIASSAIAPMDVD